jgi:prevent-host-death family protein
MKRASLTETKNNLSAVVDQVRRGETVLLLLDRGKPVARLEPILGIEGDHLDRTVRLERQGVLRRPSAAVPRDEVARPGPAPRNGASGLRALLEERQGSR